MRRSWLIYVVVYSFFVSSLAFGEVRRMTQEDIEWGDPSTTVTSAGGHIGHPLDNTFKLSAPWVDVRVHGASPSANAATNLAAFNAAIGTGNVTVIVPPGTYVIGTDGIALKDNTTIIGIGNPTLTGEGYILCVNSGSGGTTDPADNIKNVTIRGLTLSHQTLTFSEHVHLLNVNAVTNLLVENNRFIGWRGDAMYVGSSNVGGVERHNQNVTIRNNLFDGVNKDNRQAISFIDIDGTIVEGNLFKNTTRIDMPGAIDFEPNDAFGIIRNIVVTGNRFQNTYGSSGAITIVPGNLTVQPRNIIISNNMSTDIWGSFLMYKMNTTLFQYPVHIEITNNIAQGEFPIYFWGGVVDGVVISGNTIIGRTILGFANGDSISNMVISGNNFTNYHATKITTRSASHWVITGNLFSPAYPSTAITFGANATDNVSNINITGNTFATLVKPAHVSDNVAFDGASSVYMNNISSNTAALTDSLHRFPAWRTDDTGSVVNDNVNATDNALKAAFTSFNGLTPPDSFPMGVSTAVINGDNNVPGVASSPDIGTVYDGILVTHRPTSAIAFEMYTYQTYHHANFGVKEGSFWIRRRLQASNAWSSWYEQAP